MASPDSSSQRADIITYVINLTFKKPSCKLAPDTVRVVGDKDSIESETTEESGAECLAWDSVHDRLVDVSIAESVVIDVDASISSIDSCHIECCSSLVCLEGGRVLAIAVVEVHLEHVLFLLH